MNHGNILKLFSLEGRVAIITGGAGRLGVKHAEILHDAGAMVVSFDISVPPDVRDRNFGDWYGLYNHPAVRHYPVDITDRQAVFAAVDKIAMDLGGVDILINNAAFNPKVGKDADTTGDECWKPYEEFSEQQWEKELRVGLTGAQFCTQAVARYMIRENRGCILNIASTSAVTAPDHRKYKPGRFKSVAYPVVKTALLGLTRSWASYFASVAPKVRVNAVCFGAVNFGSMEPEFLAKLGERNMLRRPATPDEYKGTVLYLCSDASAFVTASTLVADGGQTAL